MKPLTLDELKVRVRKPIWIEYADGSNGEWGLVYDSHVLTASNKCKWFYDYDKNWLAYDHEPEEE